ncbi:hypothetical protein [Herbidospora yilanensis]|uniref:hypothetical protein n=1 Tax=Herbidospora yilanensis TaxID=354426 RepID=UPI0012F88344|nr:hypothetical protein [Herbidospora yilanensis]
METFGAALQRIRGKIPLRRLATLANVSYGHIADLQSGRRAPSAQVAASLDKALNAGGRLVALQKASEKGELQAVRDNDLFSRDLHAEISAGQDITSFAAWIEQTNVGSSTISMLEHTANLFAEEHTKVPPAQLLRDVNGLNMKIQRLLTTGKQRPREVRELLRIEAQVLAQSCILLGDLHDNRSAIVHGITATLCAEEAGISVAASLSAQAKTERWRGNYLASADIARRGYECSPATPLRILLACQEANAAGIVGDAERARDALQRADDAAERIDQDSGLYPWSCPRPRQALFELAVALQLGEARSAIKAASKAEEAWASGAPFARPTWAQIRLGAANAFVMMGDLAAAAEQITPVMEMEPEMRMATVTNYLVELRERLKDRQYQNSEIATTLTRQIEDFNSRALSA